MCLVALTNKGVAYQLACGFGDEAIEPSVRSQPISDEVCSHDLRFWIADCCRKLTRHIDNPGDIFCAHRENNWTMAFVMIGASHFSC